MIWVNYKSKIDHYGPAANPFPTIKKLRETIDTVSDEELQLRLTDAFIMAHYSKIQAGDELLAINGLSFVEWFEKNKFISGAGANDFGGYRAALKYLTTIYGAINRLPSDDFINFQFKSHANPEIIYTVNVPRLGIYQPGSTNMGIIKLNSFYLEDVGTTNLAVLKAVMTIRSLLVNELKDTKSVIYDLRGNSGGDVILPIHGSAVQARF
ncbi:hypothetical protein BASA83_012035 [Batrachochytrium salamandrivorans]|nr:hypothetical protein BASA83_012035 [Batrachochytrium salamandrivorans]